MLGEASLEDRRRRRGEDGREPNLFLKRSIGGEMVVRMRGEEGGVWVGRRVCCNEHERCF